MLHQHPFLNILGYYVKVIQSYFPDLTLMWRKTIKEFIYYYTQIVLN
jgi:hypothetical protein